MCVCSLESVVVVGLCLHSQPVAIDLGKACDDCIDCVALSASLAKVSSSRWPVVTTHALCWRLSAALGLAVISLVGRHQTPSVTVAVLNCHPLHLALTEIIKYVLGSYLRHRLTVSHLSTTGLPKAVIFLPCLFKSIRDVYQYLGFSNHVYRNCSEHVLTGSLPLLWSIGKQQGFPCTCVMMETYDVVLQFLAYW